MKLPGIFVIFVHYSCVTHLPITSCFHLHNTYPLQFVVQYIYEMIQIIFHREREREKDREREGEREIKKEYCLLPINMSSNIVNFHVLCRYMHYVYVDEHRFTSMYNYPRNKQKYRLRCLTHINAHVDVCTCILLIFLGLQIILMHESISFYLIV